MSITMWQDEPDFTRWLASNLDLLGEELGMKLQLIEQEHQIGSILAREADTGKMVAIENQLKEAGSSRHLGRLFAHATGCDAHVAIWVATEFQHEYAKALHRLNQWTNEEIKFYGVVIPRSSDSSCEARFCKVVDPDGWNRDVTPPKRPHIQKYDDFFRPLIAELIGTGFADEFNRRYFYSCTGRSFPSYLNGVWYAASLKGENDAWVILHIDALDSDLTKKKTKEIFDQLWDDREQIQECIACDPAPEWHWCRHDPYKYSRIKIRRDVRKDGSVDNPTPRELDETRNWMLDLLPKLKKVFEWRVAEILGREVA